MVQIRFYDWVFSLNQLINWNFCCILFLYLYTENYYITNIFLNLNKKVTLIWILWNRCVFDNWPERFWVLCRIKEANLCELICKLFHQFMLNKEQFFNKLFWFYIKSVFPSRVSKIFFLGVLFRSSILGYFRYFSVVCKKVWLIKVLSL